MRLFEPLQAASGQIRRRILHFWGGRRASQVEPEQISKIYMTLLLGVGARRALSAEPRRVRISWPAKLGNLRRILPWEGDWWSRARPGLKSHQIDDRLQNNRLTLHRVEQRIFQQLQTIVGEPADRDWFELVRCWIYARFSCIEVDALDVYTGLIQVFLYRCELVHSSFGSIFILFGSKNQL